MMRIAPFLVAAALACASEARPPVDAGQGDDAPPASAPPLGEPAWSRIDFGGPGSIHDVAWLGDGGLLVTAGVLADGAGPTVTLTRYHADGSVDWESRAESGVVLAELSPTAEGGAVVAVMRDDWLPGGPERPGGLDWYDAGGALTASWRGDDLGGGETLSDVHLVRVLPDGGVFWAGDTVDDALTTSTQVAGVVDAGGDVRWLVTVPPVDPGDLAAGTQATLTPDGDILMLASHGSAASGTSSVLVIRYAADGSEVWRTAFRGEGNGDGIAVTPAGNVVVAGNYQASLSVGDFRLEGGGDGYRPFVAELDPAGQPLRLDRLELPAAIDSQEIASSVHTATMFGDELVVGGSYYTNRSDAPQRAGYHAAAHRLDGELVAELILPTEVRGAQPPIGFGPTVADASADGRLVLGGAFSGKVDFGDGPVETGLGPDGFDLVRPFIVVLDRVDDSD